MATFYPINTPLINYFFYPMALPGTNVIAPIAGGKLFFFDDDDHNVMLPTYSDVSDPANPVINTNPIVLGDAGEWPLFYLENRFYFIVLTGPDGDINNPIDTFSHYNPARLQGLVESYDNYIPNGQFWAHNNQNATDGEITEDETNIAPGGWYFVRASGTGSTDFVTFERYDSYSANPTGNPRYACRVRCVNPGSGGAPKDVRIRFQNVNMFASASQFYTFGVNGKSNIEGDLTVSLYLIKNFGSGGSASTETLLTTFTFTSEAQFFTYAFVYGENTGKTIGENNDDYVELAIRFPVNAIFDGQVTDIVQAFGDLDIDFYPPTTVGESQYKSAAGSLPIPRENGMDLYLPIRYGKNGFEFDDSRIGVPFPCFTDTITEPDEMLLDGRRLERTAYSDTGIPYQRLYDKYGNRFGTGPGTAMAFATNSTDRILLINQDDGAVSAAANGSISPGFTFQETFAGATNQNVIGAVVNTATPTIMIFGKEYEAMSSPTFGSTINVILLYPGDTNYVYNPENTNTNVLYRITGFTDPIGDYEGKYIQWTIPVVAAPVTTGVWFQVDGVGADPGIGLKVDLNGNDTTNTIMQKIVAGINGRAATDITVTSAATIPPGAWFTYDTPTENFYVWAKVGGVGTDPAVSARTGIQVDLDLSDTAAQVATKYINAINSKFFALPKPEGMFFRGVDESGYIDPEGQFRFNQHGGLPDSDIGGTYQYPMIQGHFHKYTATVDPQSFLGTNEAQMGSAYEFPTPDTTSTGVFDTRPWNMAVYWVIKY